MRQAVPEIARILQEFENQSSKKEKEPDKKHHEQNSATQKLFLKHVTDVLAEYRKCGNPFLDYTDQLSKIDTRKIMPEAAVKNVQQAEERGKQQYDEFCEHLGAMGTKKVHDPIQKKKFVIFKEATKKKASKARMKLTEAKYDIRFSTLVIS